MVSALGLAKQWYRRLARSASADAVYTKTRRTPYTWGLAALTCLAAAGCGTPDDEENGAHPWANQTFLLNLPEDSWTKPDAGSVLEGFVPQFLLGFGEAMGDTLPVTLGTAVNGVQDPCGPTLQTTAQATVPGFSLGPVTLPIQVDHKDPNEMITVNGTIRNLVMTDIMPEAGGGETSQLTAEADLRELYPLFQAGFGPAMDAAQACGAFGEKATCEPCASDQEPYCLVLQANYLSAEPFAGTVTPIDASVLTQPSATCPLRP